MTEADLRNIYGEEYPAAVTSFGIRMPLVRETRFNRHYSNEEHNYSTSVSKFADNSASISFELLKAEWKDWTDKDRRDFCIASWHLHDQQDFPDIIRLIMGDQDEKNWSTVANLVANALPADEAFPLLAAALERTSSLPESNLIQAIALTKHIEAVPFINSRLDELWRRSEIWNDDSFLNWTAADAINAIGYLIELGENPAPYEEKVRALLGHPCKGNQDAVRRNLHEYYDWVPALEPWIPPGQR